MSSSTIYMQHYIITTTQLLCTSSLYIFWHFILLGHPCSWYQLWNWTTCRVLFPIHRQFQTMPSRFSWYITLPLYFLKNGQQWPSACLTASAQHCHLANCPLLWPVYLNKTSLNCYLAFYAIVYTDWCTAYFYCSYVVSKTAFYNTLHSHI